MRVGSVKRYRHAYMIAVAAAPHDLVLRQKLEEQTARVVAYFASHFARQHDRGRRQQANVPTSSCSVPGADSACGCSKASVAAMLETGGLAGLPSGSVTGPDFAPGQCTIASCRRQGREQQQQQPLPRGCRDVCTARAPLRLLSGSGLDEGSAGGCDGSRTGGAGLAELELGHSAIVPLLVRCSADGRLRVLAAKRGPCTQWITRC